MRLEDESNIEHLRSKAVVLARENERLSKKLVDLLRENLALKGMSPEQLQAALFEIDAHLNRLKSDETKKSASTERRGESASNDDAKKPRIGHGPKSQPKLPVETVVHDLDDADKVCPSCGLQLLLWEGQDDESEEIETVERRFFIRKNIRKKYRCRCGCVEMALIPPRLIPGGRYSNDFAVEVAAQKYVDHLPFARQVQIMKREGLDVDTQTLWDQTSALANKLHPAWLALRATALTEPVLGFDETRWEVFGKGSAEKKSWTMWQLSTRQVVFYDIAQGRDTIAGKAFLEGFKGIAVGDAAAIHKSMAKTAEYSLAYCWAHGRRKFIKAENSEPIRAKQFLDMVAQLYVIEAQAPPGANGDELRRTLRNEKSRPVVKQIQAWLKAQRALPESDLGKAMKYIGACWTGLCVFLDNPLVPIDNNQTERGFRGPAIGRNNFYGSHSKRGTQVAAIFYSLVETAKLRGVDPKRYLKTALAAALQGNRIPLPHELC